MRDPYFMIVNSFFYLTQRTCGRAIFLFQMTLFIFQHYGDAPSNLVLSSGIQYLLASYRAFLIFVFTLITEMR